MNLRRKEIFWILATILLATVLYIIMFGVNGLNSNKTLDINIHDTYLAIANTHLILLWGVLIFFLVYLIRMLRRSFKNLTANVIFIIATIILIALCTQIISIVDSAAQFSNPSEYSGSGDLSTEVHENGFDSITKILLIVQVLLLIFLTFCGFKTGKNYRQ